MSLSLRDIVSFAAAALARVLTPALQRRLMRLCVFLAADVPQLGTAWVVQFSEPMRGGGFQRVAIDAEMQQFGRVVRGRGHRQGEPGDPFEYRGIIKRNVFYGTFSRANPHVLAGTGAFVLYISPDSRCLSGHCIWYDNQLDDVWTSPYTWLRQG